MNLNIKLSLNFFKPSFVHLINKNLLEYNFISCTKEFTYKIIKSNKKTNKYFSKYIDLSSYISYSLLNNIFLHYYSSSLTDFLFNLIKISSYNNNVPLSSIEYFSLSKTLYLISNFIKPIFLEKMKTQNYGIIIKGIKLSNVIMKLLYIIKDDFMYTDLFDYLFGIMTINNYKKDNNNENMNIYLSFIFLFFVVSYQCYNKIKIKEMKKEKERKIKIKIINEIRKNEVIPIPDKKYYLLRNKNFTNLINNKKGLCLICSKKFNSPTAIKCCGGVFCFKCINNYLNIHQKCFLCFQKIFDSDINKSLIKIYT